METLPPSSLGWADSLQVLWQDGEIAFCRGWRVEDGAPPTPIFAITPRSDHPPAAVLERLAHEYALRRELDDAWALQPRELLRDGGRTVLVLSDPGGAPLDQLLDGRPMPVERFLPLAIRIAAALGAAHGRGLIHKDVKPAHIIVDEASGAVRFTGFGIARRAPRERPEPAPPELIAGALAYMAPEQAGRMNRSIDSRSDLYALGVTFYQMLTGVLPFVAAEPIEWVHCHMARRPAPPSERIAGLPQAVSDLVMKLLAKAAEDRYQTASGLVADLERCLAAWRADGAIAPFALGARDVASELRIPEKLYGREREVEALLAAFERVAVGGQAELVLVGGYSGIGKSSVVQELHKALVPCRGLFAAGKFDQYQRDIPYATLAQAVRTLLRQILAQSDEAVAGWRAAILEAVSPNGRLVAALIPELDLVIGPQPECPRLGRDQSEHRFQTVWRRFLGVFARPEHPLVLFLDDLQWLDAATLKLLAHLVVHPEVRNVLFIGAYRDNEVGPDHPLRAALDEVRRAGARVQAIMLKPLSGGDVRRLVSDTLQCGARAVPLARLLHRKTSGNPFFVMQVLTTLRDEALLTFDPARGAWNWDIRRIETKGYTDNVVDLMVAKLKRLPQRTQEALKAFACLGNTAEVETLALADAGDAPATHAALAPAVREGLVCRRGGAYQFLHDRIQEAAYALTPAPLRAEAHLRIGRRLLSGLGEPALHARVFEVVSQFNRGAALITAREEKDRIAELNLIAGQRAKQATAYAAALTFLGAGEALLARNRWTRSYKLAFALELGRAECEHLTSAFDQAAARLAALSRRAATRSDLAAVSRLRIANFSAMDQVDEAVAACLEHLRQAGIALTPHPSDAEVAAEYAEVWRRIGDRPIDSLVDLPRMSDPEWRATLDLLVDVQPSTLSTDNNLYAVVTGRMVNLSLEHGNTDSSCLAYAFAGSILSVRFGDYAAGGQLGQLALDLVEQAGLDRFAGRVYTVFADTIVPWVRNIRHGLPILRRGAEAAREGGDLAFAVASRIGVIRYLLATGEPLVQAQEEAERAFAFVRGARFATISIIIGAQLALIRRLRGVPATDPSFDDPALERRLAEDPRLFWGAAFYWTRKLQSLVLAGDYWAALDAAAKAERRLWPAAPFFDVAEHHLFAALAHAGACATASPEERRQSVAAVARRQAQLAEWAAICPENFEDRAALVAAELARLEGRALDAVGLYERAIACARRSGFVQNEALAHELAGAFFLSEGWDNGGMAHLRDARACYLQWGAVEKVRQLDQRHPGLASRDQFSPAATIGASAGQLDLSSVMQASQAISGQIELDKLVETLLTLAIQNVGADRGLLILPGDGARQIGWEARALGDKIALTIRDAAIADGALPASVVRYVTRTGEYVLLDDTARPHAYADDAYFRAEPARSILCLPLLKQARLAGVLYLENAATAHAFTPDRIELLNLLAAQAVISLENARLYSDLQKREGKIRRLFESNIIGIYLWDIAGHVTAANDACLEILGYTRQELEAGMISWAGITPPEHRAGDAQIRLDLRQTGACRPYETELIRRDGTRAPVLLGGALFEDSFEEGVAFVLDRTEAQQAERRQKTLVDELNHRVKNTLATVQSLCAQTLRSAESPAAFQAEFEGRLAALSQAHNVLNRSGWQGAGLRMILEQVLAPHGVADTARFELSGAEVQLGPTSAVTLGIAFHELATNALKYGALSTPGGGVRIAWEIRPPGRLHIVWEERGGPAVQAPRRRGFGSRLIERSLPAQLGGEVALRYLPQGVRCEMDAALAEIGRF